MSGEAIFAQEDIKECYQILLPDINSRSQLVLVSKDITEASGVEESLSYLMNRSTLEQLKTEINQEIDIVFGSRSNQIVKSVIKRFIQNYSASVRPIRLGQIIQEAEPLLRLNSSDPYFSNLPDKLKQFIGFKDTDELEVKQFKSILNDDLGIDSTILKPSQAEDQILIVKEYGGFPLRLINGLEEIRNHYIREQNRDGSSCHSDYQIQFTDIIPPDAHLIEKLADVFYPCLAFELISLNPETRLLQLEYYDDLRRCYYTAKLSPVWNQSLEELANNQEITATLKQLLEDVISQIRQNSNLWENNYLLKLQKFVDYVDKLPESSPNYSCKSTVVGARGTIVKQGVINRLIQRIKGEIQNTLPLSVNDNLTARGDLIVNRGDSLERELKQLQKGLDQGNFNQKEYEVKRKEIMDKYGLS
jgi:hypothetical protein